MHRGCEGFGLKEAVDKILNRKKEIEESEISFNKELERRNEEVEEINKKREEYYEKHMKEETERINKLEDWYKYKLNEIKEAPVDRRSKTLRGLYRYGQKNKHLGVTITSFGTFDKINLPKYPPKLEYPDEEIEEDNEIYYDVPTMHTLLAGYKPYDYKNYFNQTIKAYQGHLIVKASLVDSIRGLLGPRNKYKVNKVKDTISAFKFRKKDLVNSIVCKLNDVSDYKSLTEVQKACLFNLMKTLELRSIAW